MRRTTLLVLVGSMTASAVLAVACGEDDVTVPPAETDAGTSDEDGASPSSPGDGDDGGATNEPDGGHAGEKDGGDSCTGKFEAPNLNGPGPCGTLDFGEPAAGFGPVDVDAGVDYVGTALTDGVYDAVNAERMSGSTKGSWRETFVVKGNRFTRVRQINTGSGGGPGPISYRSGTLELDPSGGQTIKFTYDCAHTGNADVDAGPDTLPFDAVVASDCSARYRYGATGIRITLRRR